jgi:Zn-dependent metalloprotease
MTRIACCSIAPPDLLARLIEEGSPEERRAAVQTMAASASMRTRRSLVGRLARELDQDVRALAYAQPPAVGDVRQTVYDLENGGRSQLPGQRVRGAGDPEADDKAVNDVYDATDTTYDFYKTIYGRDSVDDRGMELISSVHYSTNFDNAFWEGAQMAYGDGSGRIFKVGALTSSLSVIAHEITHAVTQFTAGLEYSSQPGALNEHFSDAFGALATQYARGQSADEAEWLVGEGTLADGLGVALRSLKEPGAADVASRQPAHMDEYKDLPDDGDPANDNGGVHINSGIPNRAFYLTATAIGGNAWEKAGKIWFQTLTGGKLSATSDFEQTARATVEVAGELFADGSEPEAVETAWREVGVLS